MNNFKKIRAIALGLIVLGTMTLCAYAYDTVKAPFWKAYQPSKVEILKGKKSAYLYSSRVLREAHERSELRKFREFKRISLKKSKSFHKEKISLRKDFKAQRVEARKLLRASYLGKIPKKIVNEHKRAEKSLLSSFKKDEKLRKIAYFSAKKAEKKSLFLG